jgi:hypothetical protein
MAHLMLDGVEATGASASIFPKKVVKDHTVACYYIDADSSVTAVTVNLEASDDNRGVADADAHWYTLASYSLAADEITAKKAMFHVINKPVKRVRLKLDVFTGAGSGDKLYGRYIPY